MKPDDLTGLAELFPADRFRTDPAAQAAFESDGLLAYTTRPRGVVFPETADEVISTVRWCHEHSVPLVARGSGTGLSGGAMPHRDGVVIALNRLNRVLHVDPLERTATVQCGVVNLAVSQAARPHGLYFAPDPSSQSVCTIGGNIAFNSGGAHCLKYGMTAGHTLAMDVVLGDGTVTSLGGASLEHTGPDSTGFFCGNEGMLGIALQATLRLLPLPETFHTVLIGYDTIREAGNAVGEIIAANLLPGAMEIMDAMSIRAAEAAVACGYPKNANSVLIVELEGSAQRVEVEKQILTDVIQSTQPSAVEIAKNDAERLAIWKGRKSVFSAAGRLSPDFIVQDGVVPRRRLGEALERIEALSQECGVPVANVFHAGDGNLHPLIMYDGKIAGAFDKANAFAQKILRLCIEMGGSITGEHGVGIEKREVFSEMFDEATIDLMHRVRAEMDPHRICNPGKMFPDALAPALTTSGLHPLEKAGVIFRD
ncbi:FAD-binding oxidoreductase [Rhodopirellula halodulae]|uniref:FAD-binding oxidoreductase n=1 Tax=Rhodopirellula halodulae TaxID=2894198 RepID=UPI001E5D44F1|nr:FAD-linked oxidase C-terminal domain-containing protein [Rhodopirellula sp. JC737]MCC9655970.1 FAD-binding protein [Rhodopirellula sp. JC737]